MTDFTRRHFVQLGSAAALDPRLRDAASKLEYLTPVERGQVLDKGKAGVARLSPEKLRDAGLHPETWTLEVAAEGGSAIERPVTLDWSGLMRLAASHAVRFLHVCVCANGNDPFHMTLWEGVPLREVLWMAGLKAQIRRVYYQSYNAPGLAPFQGSLPLGQVLETPPGQTPVVLAYKMNGEVMPAAHGGPVRVVVPGTYGNKSIKWVRRVVLTNDYRANDSDAELKQLATFIAAELGPHVPWHVSRFHPDYRMTDRPPTPEASIRRAIQIGKAAGLRYIYAGNLWAGDDTESTRCHSCGQTLIERRGYTIISNRLTAGGRCPKCQTELAGVFQ